MLCTSFISGNVVIKNIVMYPILSLQLSSKARFADFMQVRIRPEAEGWDIFSESRIFTHPLSGITDSDYLCIRSNL